MVAPETFLIQGIQQVIMVTAKTLPRPFAPTMGHAYVLTFHTSMLLLIISMYTMGLIPALLSLPILADPMMMYPLFLPPDVLRSTLPQALQPLTPVGMAHSFVNHAPYFLPME